LAHVYALTNISIEAEHAAYKGRLELLGEFFVQDQTSEQFQRDAFGRLCFDSA
jgi:hypothetical protein